MSEIIMYVLYFIYYLLPLGFLIPIYLLWKRKSLMRGTSDFSLGREEESSAILDIKKRDIRILQIFLVLFLLVFMPVAHYTSTSLSDGLMDRTRIFRGEGSYIDHPVAHQIGPSYDTDTVLEEMEEEQRYWEDWIVEGLKEEVDFDEITRFPGRLGIYYLRRSLGTGVREQNVVITYTYFSPIPITRVYGFYLHPEDEMVLLEKGPSTLIYPMDPADANPF